MRSWRALDANERKLLKWRVAIALCLLVGASIWANAHYTLEKRVERLSERMARGGGEESVADEGKLFAALRSLGGGNIEHAGRCRDDGCWVSMSRTYLLGFAPNDERRGSLSVSVYADVRATTQPHGSAPLLPDGISWEAQQWRWEVSYRDERDENQRFAYSGQLGDFTSMASLREYTMLVSLISNMAQGMRDGMRRSNSLARILQ